MPCDPAVRAMCNYQQKHILGFSGLVAKMFFMALLVRAETQNYPEVHQQQNGEVTSTYTHGEHHAEIRMHIHM